MTCTSSFLPFCSCKSCILDILPSLFVDICHLLLLCFYLCSYLFGQTAGQLITHRYRLSWSPSPSSYSFEFLFFCCIPHSASLSMGCTANPKCVLKKQSAHSELQKAAIFFPPFTERCFRELPHCFAKKYKSMNGNIFFYSDQASSAGPPDPSFLVGLVGIGNEIMMRKDKSCNYFIFFFIVLSEHVLHNCQGFM